MLERVGFKDVIIVALNSTMVAIRQAISSCKGISADIVGISEDSDWGTTDSIRHIKDKIKTDLLVLSCDILSDFHLHLLADVHRLHDTTVTMLLAPARSDMDSVPGVSTKRKLKTTKEIIGFTKAKTAQSRVVFLENEADIEEEELSFRLSLLMQQPNIHIRTDLTDMHLYIIKKQLVEYIANNTSRSSFRSELLPYLVKKQWRNRKQAKSNEDAPPSLNESSRMTIGGLDSDPNDIFSYLCGDPQVERIRDLSLRSAAKTGASLPMCSRDARNPLSVYAYVCEDGFCMRVNSMQAFVEANRLIAKHLAQVAPNLAEIPLIHPSVKIEDKTQVGSDSMVAEETTIGTRVSVKRSTIGRHCVIGSHVKIANCTVLDRAVIMDGCTLQGSVICDGVTVREKSTIKDSLIGSKRVLQAMSTVVNESLVESTAMMEFD